MTARQERCQRVISYNMINRDKIILAIKQGAEWFSDIQTKTGIKSLRYFYQALSLARREGCIDEIVIGKYCIHKEVFMMKTEAQLEREKETGMVMEKKYDAEKGMIVVTGTIYKEIDPKGIEGTIKTLEKQLEDTEKVIEQFETQSQEEVKRDKSLDDWMVNSKKAAILNKREAAIQQLEQRKKDRELIKTDLNELLEMMKEVKK